MFQTTAAERVGPSVPLRSVSTIVFWVRHFSHTLYRKCSSFRNSFHGLLYKKVFSFIHYCWHSRLTAFYHTSTVNNDEYDELPARMIEDQFTLPLAPPLVEGVEMWMVEITGGASGHLSRTLLEQVAIWIDLPIDLLKAHFTRYLTIK